MIRRMLYAAFGLLVLIGSGGALAQEAPQRAGRLSYLEGSVSVQSPGVEGWAPAERNQPVTTGTALWTEPGARAEVQVGAASVRIDSETELNVTRLDDEAFEISVPQGAVNLHRPTTSDGPIWVDTPSGPVTLTEPGFYRVTEEGVERAEAAPTEFDRWAMAREAQESRALAETLRHVSPQTTGYQDLATYGSWTVTPQYGAVWYPRAVPVGWVPYRYGHWAYVFPWGWTWIDDAPWGFAPFHYGSWVVVHGRWGWWPGPRHVRPVFVPARVVIVRGGHDRHAPPARWIPLAPHEHHTRGAVDVNIDVNRFANRHAISSASPRMVERSLQHRDAPGPRGVWQGHERRDRDLRDHKVRGTAAALVATAPAFAAATPALRAEAPRPGWRAEAPHAESRHAETPRDDHPPNAESLRPDSSQVENPRDGLRQRFANRHADRETLSTRPAATPRAAAPHAAAPRASAPVRSIERPQPPVTWHRDPAQAGERRAPEARVAPPTPAPEVQPRLSAPARAQREAAHEQRGRAHAEGVAPRRPSPVPQAQAATPQIVRPRATAQPVPQVQREIHREPPVRYQARPARMQSAPASGAAQADAPAAQRDRGGPFDRRGDPQRKG